MSSSKPVWMMVLEAAQRLSERREVFERSEIIDYINNNYPETNQGTISGHIGYMSKPDFRHPYLKRVGHAKYRLR